MRGRIVFRVFSLTVLCLFLTGAMGLFNGGFASAAEPNAAKVKSPGGHEKIASKISTRGTAKILVQVNTPFSPEGLLSTAEVTSQRTAISAGQDRLLAELAASGKKPLKTHKYAYTPYLALTVDGSQYEAVLASENVTGVYEDKLARPKLDKSVPRIGAPLVHATGVSGTGVAVAVLDTGVDKLHPFLKGSVVSEACFSTDEKADQVVSLCPNRAEEVTQTAGSAMPYAGKCPKEECGHGTHVAGIIAGRSGIQKSPGPGVAPGASIIAIQVFSRMNSKDDCDEKPPCIQSYDSDQIKALERVYELRNTYTIAAANMSLGGGKYNATCDDDPIKAVIDTLRAAGIATIVATGNEDYCGYTGAPACVSTAISVGATDENDAVAEYSNSATFMTLMAPGSTITSSVPRADGTYEAWEGTSMATPHAAGAWALMKQAKPSATVDEILASFTSTGVTVTDTGKCPTVAKQRIDVAQAYQGSGGKPALTVVKTGKGSGTVTSNSGAIDCGSTCSATFDGGTLITLTATADSDSTFAGWSGGGCSGTEACSLTLNSSTTLTASFTGTCEYKLIPDHKSFGTKGGTFIAKVKATGEADCPAPSVSVADPWLAAAVTTYSKNKGSVKVFVYRNDNPDSRSSTITIGGESFTVEQGETSCSISSLDPTNQSFEAAEDSGKFTVHVDGDCAWTAEAVSPADWITISSGDSGSGTREISFDVSRNETDAKRVGKITVTLTDYPAKKKSFTVKQAKQTDALK